ncbi:MAG: glycosyltransferase family 2 protein [Thermoanaerobaculia bacterium]|nr:glycosyltransferase family 2 protein [Thermoanaerobaculia bacterium]
MSADRSPWPVLLAATLVAVVVWGLYHGARVLSPGVTIGLYGVANIVLFLDLFDLIVRSFVRRAQAAPPDSNGAAPSVELNVAPSTPFQRRLHLRPWAMVVSVHNAEPDLPRFLQAYRRYRSRLWVIDDASTDGTVARLRQAGVRVVEQEYNLKKPAAIRELLTRLPEEIETVMVLDPDVTIISDNLEEILFEHQLSGMAGLAPRVRVRQDGFLALLQSFEYELCGGIGRKGLADVCTNPGASIYRRRDLAEALDRHTLSVYAEDLEISLILLAQGQGIYYDDRLVLETEGKRELAGWFSQRVGWFFGLLRVYVARRHEIARIGRRRVLTAYQYLVYSGVLTLLLHPLRMASLGLLGLSALGGLGLFVDLPMLGSNRLMDPIYFETAYVQYLLFSFLALWIGVPKGERGALIPVVPVYFFYSLLLVLPATFGYVNWITLRLAGRRLYSDHFQDDAGARRAASPNVAPGVAV